MTTTTGTALAPRLRAFKHRLDPNPAQATLLAREIAGRVEQDMEYPGQVQVTVVRESRAVEVAR